MNMAGSLRWPQSIDAFWKDFLSEPFPQTNHAVHKGLFNYEAIVAEQKIAGRPRSRPEDHVPFGNDLFENLFENPRRMAAPSGSVSKNLVDDLVKRCGTLYPVGSPFPATVHGLPDHMLTPIDLSLIHI